MALTLTLSAKPEHRVDFRRPDSLPYCPEAGGISCFFRFGARSM